MTKLDSGRVCGKIWIYKAFVLLLLISDFSNSIFLKAFSLSRMTPTLLTCHQSLKEVEKRVIFSLPESRKCECWGWMELHLRLWKGVNRQKYEYESLVLAIRIHYFLLKYFKQDFLKPQVFSRLISKAIQWYDKLELGIGVRLPRENPLPFTLKYVLLSTLYSSVNSDFCAYLIRDVCVHKGASFSYFPTFAF